MRKSLSFEEILFVHLIDGHEKSVVSKYVVKRWMQDYYVDPNDVLNSLLERGVLVEKSGIYNVSQPYRELLKETKFIDDISKQQPKVIDPHKAYLFYKSSKDMTTDDIYISLYDDVLEYSREPRTLQLAHEHLSLIFEDLGELRHSDHHMHASIMLDVLIQMENMLINIRMKRDVDEVRARFPLSRRTLERYRQILNNDYLKPSELRDEIIRYTDKISWFDGHKYAAANYIVLKTIEDYNAENYLLGQLFSYERIYNIKTRNFIKMYSLVDNYDTFAVQETQRERVLDAKIKIEAMHKEEERRRKEAEARERERLRLENIRLQEERRLNKPVSPRERRVDERGNHPVRVERPGALYPMNRKTWKEKELSKQASRSSCLLNFSIILTVIGLFPIGLIFVWFI